jgi:hypothetical protein
MVISNTIAGAALPRLAASRCQPAGVAATPSFGAVFDVVVRCDGTAPCAFPLGAAPALAVLVARGALALLPLALPLPAADVFALLAALAREAPVVPLPLGVFRLAAALFGFADALRVARAAVDTAAAGLAMDMPLVATVSDFTAVSIALVAELMACIAEAIDLAEVVAFVMAEFSLVVAAVTLVVAAVTLAAADEMSRGAAVVLVLLVVATDLPSS